MKRTIRAHSGHRRRRRRLLRGGGKRARAGRRGGRDDPSALSAYHRVFVGLVRYATAWSETTRRTRFETSFAKRPPPGWIPRREGRERREGGERATVNYPSATSPNWTRSGSGRRKRRKEKEDLFLSLVRFYTRTCACVGTSDDLTLSYNLFFNLFSWESFR